jgi:hypothetical protein
MARTWGKTTHPVSRLALGCTTFGREIPEESASALI